MLHHIGLTMIQRNYFNPNRAMDIPQHRFEMILYDNFLAQFHQSGIVPFTLQGHFFDVYIEMSAKYKLTVKCITATTYK